MVYRSFIGLSRLPSPSKIVQNLRRVKPKLISQTKSLERLFEYDIPWKENKHFVLTHDLCRQSMISTLPLEDLPDYHRFTLFSRENQGYHLKGDLQLNTVNRPINPLPFIGYNLDNMQLINQNQIVLYDRWLLKLILKFITLQERERVNDFVPVYVHWSTDSSNKVMKNILINENFKPYQERSWLHRHVSSIFPKQMQEKKDHFIWIFSNKEMIKKKSTASLL